MDKELKREAEQDAKADCKCENIATEYSRSEPLYDYCIECGRRF